MLKDITIGQYVKGKSFLHCMDARVKILLTIVFISMLFVVSSVGGYVIMGVFTLFLVYTSGVPLKFILRGLKPMLMILIFTVAINLFFTPGEPVWSVKLSWFTVQITKEGLKIGALMLVRLIFLVLGTSLLTLTTTPLMLTDGIEKLLKPLEKIKVPAHEIAMMMTIAIRFIPTLADETDKIMKAQTARGADFESGNVIKRARAMIPLLVPLFISAFRRADELAVAMDARCYHGGANRTRMKQMKLSWRDGAAVIILFAVFAVAFIVGSIDFI